MPEVEIPESTESNVMRHKYKELSTEEKNHMTMIKDAGLYFYKLLAEISDQPLVDDLRFPSRELSLAATKIEEAVMWATKHITK